MKQHSMMLMDMKMGEAPNLKKGNFVSNEERWMHKHDALVRFHERYGHSFVPLSGRRATNVQYNMLFDDDNPPSPASTCSDTTLLKIFNYARRCP